MGEGPDQKKATVACDFVVGADGAFSKVREALGRVERLNFTRQYIKTAYKELSIPPSADGEYAMEAHALHIWPRDDFMLIALPNADKSFTCTLFIPVCVCVCVCVRACRCVCV
jgi:kynurenine 3-monooxygenase